MKITILTEPPFKLYHFLKWLKFRLKNKTLPKYDGHYAVTRSIVEGLKKIGADYNYNPSIFKINKIVYVPGGINALRFAIILKKLGIIKFLVAGPNLVVLPTDFNNLITSKEIDLYLVNSRWVEDMYLAICPELNGHIDFLPAGVDTDFWKPINQNKDRKNILIYYKRPTKNLFLKLKSFLEDNGFNVEVIYYGSYTLNEYKEALDRNSIVLYLVEQESQGISLSEAWSMNVPTLVWNPEIFFWAGKNYEASSAPYLNDQVGMFFKNADDFAGIINTGLNSSVYSSREWVLNNMSDEVCSNMLLTKIKKYYQINQK